MNLYFLLAALTFVNAGVVPDAECDGVKFDGVYHEKEILKTGFDISHLAVDYNTNKMYFRFIGNRTVYEFAVLNLDTKESEVIDDVPTGLSQTVDQNTHSVYIGEDDGIYKYDDINKKSELYAAKDIDVWRIFFKKDVLYFTEFPFEFMYTYVDGNITKFKDLEGIKIEEFVIDGEDVMFYSNATGFYAQKKGGKDAVLYSDKLNVRALTVDIYGNAYMCTIDAIYRIYKQSSSLEKLMDVNDCWGLAFDNNNNIIYSDGDSLFRFKIRLDKTC